MEIQPIGVVHSSVTEPAEMPFEGVPGWLELFPQFAKGLEGIAGGTHLLVIGWLHRSNRDTLVVSPNRLGPRPPGGVFGLRSSHRPNPLSLTSSKLLRVDDLNLYLERLDLIDGTPVVDIKRYSPSWDCIFSARSSRDLRFPGQADRTAVLDGMMVEATNFHGETCVGVALGVRLLYHAMVEWQMAQKDPKLVVRMGDNGCVADALQGLSGATLGNGRMKVPGGRAFRLSYDGQKALAFQTKELTPSLRVEEVLRGDIDELFAIRRDVYSEGNGPHGGRPSKRPAAPEKQAVLLERLRQVAAEGSIPCALAHHLAQEMGVNVRDVGWAADVEKVRITSCMLGCFR